MPVHRPSIGLAAVPVGAQTTATERAAASEILQQIDALQQRLDPTGMAGDLAGRDDATQDALVRRTTEIWNTEMQALSDYIGHNPGVGWEEHLRSIR